MGGGSDVVNKLKWEYIHGYVKYLAVDPNNIQVWTLEPEPKQFVYRDSGLRIEPGQLPWRAGVDWQKWQRGWNR